MFCIFRNTHVCLQDKCKIFLYCRLFHRQGAKLMHSKPLKGKPIEKQKQILEKAFKFTCVRNPFER